MDKFKGIFPALLTPFTKGNKINEAELERLVKLNIEKGVTGFYVGGSTAEAFVMSLDERRYILDIVTSVAKDKTIIYHVGDISTDNAISLAKHAQKLSVDAISAIPPFYYNFSFQEIKKYYYDIVDSVELPMIIYNFPAFSGVTLNIGNIGEFLCDDRFIGVKHTSNDFYSLERFKKEYDKLVYNGFDEMFLAGISMGADGGIGSTYNIMAEKFIKMQQVFSKGRVEEAQAIQSEVNQIIAAIVKVGVLPAEKEILNLMGFDFGCCRAPFKRATEEETEYLRKEVLPFMECGI